MIHKKLFKFTVLASIFFQASCMSQAVDTTQVKSKGRTSSIDLFSYYNSEHNVQLTALMSGKFVVKNNCLFLDSNSDLITPVFNANDVKFDLEAKTITLNGVTIPLNEETLLGGGFVNKRALPNLDTRGSNKCLTDRVAILYSLVELTPDMRKRWLLPPKIQRSFFTQKSYVQ